MLATLAGLVRKAFGGSKESQTCPSNSNSYDASDSGGNLIHGALVVEKNRDSFWTGCWRKPAAIRLLLAGCWGVELHEKKLRNKRVGPGEARKIQAIEEIVGSRILSLLQGNSVTRSGSDGRKDSKKNVLGRKWRALRENMLASGDLLMFAVAFHPVEDIGAILTPMHCSASEQVEKGDDWR